MSWARKASYFVVCILHKSLNVNMSSISIIKSKALRIQVNSLPRILDWFVEGSDDKAKPG